MVVNVYSKPHSERSKVNVYIYCSPPAAPPQKNNYRNILSRLFLCSWPIEVLGSRMRRRERAGGSRRAQFSTRHRRSALLFPYRREGWDTAPGIEI